MKFFLTPLLALSIFSIFFISCDSDTGTEKETKSITLKADTKNILNDPTFKDYVYDGYMFNQNIKDINKLNEILSKVDEKATDFTTEEKEGIAYSAGLSSFDEYEIFIIKQQTRVNTLEKDYGFVSGLTDNQREDLIFQHIDLIEPQVTDLCDRERRNCKIIANSIAVAGHVACVTADATIFLGVVCHGAVLTALYATLDNCEIAYIRCKEAA